MTIEPLEQLVQSFEIAGQDFSRAGEVSSKIRRILQQIGAPVETIRRTSVATYEAEMNVVIHAQSGRIDLSADRCAIQITVSDVGPGIVDLDLAMQPGYSTASEEVREMGFGAGMGLSNMARCADDLSIDSVVGQGTTVKMQFRTNG
ncbi:MAG: ATP-binding protein [Armatimonadetes bacterium]|nr:ATP-binding protein [Armatimonadota bacterium]